MKSRFDKWMEDPEFAKANHQEALILEVTEALLDWMNQEGISKSSLAKKLGKSRSFVSQLFTGQRNMTLRTLSDITWAVGLDVRFQMAKKKQQTSHSSSVGSICFEPSGSSVIQIDPLEVKCVWKAALAHLDVENGELAV